LLLPFSSIKPRWLLKLKKPSAQLNKLPLPLLLLPLLLLPLLNKLLLNKLLLNKLLLNKLLLLLLQSLLPPPPLLVSSIPLTNGVVSSRFTFDGFFDTCRLSVIQPSS
jgi:hypothetical protein